MPFSEKAKLTAIAVVQVFETGRPFGDYSAVAVLNDGAGISYGVKQFTHKSGSLAAVVGRFVKLGGKLPPPIAQVLPHLKAKNAIAPVANNASVRKAFADLGKNPKMQRAQREIAFENYLQPAINACEGDDFIYPLSLCVIYDSMVHGSFARIRDRVTVERPGNGSMKPEEYEQEWIKRYVRARHAWLRSIPRLKSTSYRTSFFLGEISAGNWDLDLPISVHGRLLTENELGTFELYAGDEFDDELIPEITGDLDVPISTDSAAAPIDPALRVETEDETTATVPADPPPNSDEQPPPAIHADNVQINEGDAPPPAFTPENLVMETPPKEGSTSTTAKVTILGVTVPAGVYAVIQGIQEWIEKGFIDVKAVLAVLLELIRNNVKYVTIFAGLIVSVVIAKKVFKQITFILQMAINANPNWHNVTLVAPEPPDKRWWQLWK